MEITISGKTYPIYSGRRVLVRIERAALDKTIDDEKKKGFYGAIEAAVLGIFRKNKGVSALGKPENKKKKGFYKAKGVITGFSPQKGTLEQISATVEMIGKRTVEAHRYRGPLEQLSFARKEGYAMSVTVAPDAILAVYD
jgi:hypothetical protein